MSGEASGTARELPTGRLANFEDDDVVVSGLTLPPRPRTSAAQQHPAPAADTSSADGAPPPTAADQGTEQPAVPRADRIRGSNVHIPVELLKPLTAMCKAEGLSHGEVIIMAIERTYDRLPELMGPPATAGGSLFAERRSHTGRTPPGPVTPLNYRLRQSDFDTLDALVARLGASSRTQLINAALTGYLTP